MNEKPKEKTESSAQFAVAEVATPPAVGHVKITLKDVRTGEEKVIVDKHNTITKNLYVALTGYPSPTTLGLLTGFSNPINAIAFGTSGSAESEDNTTITGAYTVPVQTPLTYTYSATTPSYMNGVEFTGTLPASDLNGTVIREIGLFFATGPRLAARISFGDVTKCAYFSLSVVWTITWPAPTGGALNALCGVLARLISHQTYPEDYVQKTQFGAGSAAPDPSNIHLQLSVAAVDVTTVTCPDEFSVRFVGYLDSFTANGYTIAEAGLLTAGGILIARETFAGRYKDADHMLEFGITIRLHS